MISLLVAVLLGVCQPNQSDSAILNLKDVERKLVDAYARLQSYSAKLEIHQDTKNQYGRQQQEMQWDIQWMRKDGRVLFHKEGEGETVSEFQNEEIETENHYLHICDGQFKYALSVNRTDYATKENIDPDERNKVEADFKHMRRKGTLKVIPDETICNVPCFGIELVLSEKDPDLPFVRHRYFYAKDSGIEMKSQSFDKDGNVGHSMTLTELKVGVEHKPELFEAKLPEGIRIIDHTKK